MKGSAFGYARASSVVNAIELLVAHSETTKILAGGQSLLPAMNLRLLSPDLLVDISDLAELRGIAVEQNSLRIGALTRHVEVLASHEVATRAPLLTQAVTHVAHPAIRNRGTLGGNLAHGDPASELPACMLALNATIVVRGPVGERRIPAIDFFKGIYETALSPLDLLIAVELPALQPNSKHFFHEFARRRGDYALAGLSAQAIVEGDRLADLRLAFFAVGDRPILARSAEMLINTDVNAAVLAEALAALGEELNPQDDQQASTGMRRHLAKVLLARCVSALLNRPDLAAGQLA
jgi:aerobic carbon-monoxide dehydrogenase medium subunit